jgi:hypothetical protein
MGEVFARFALRLRWYLRALGRNQLIRASDRLEALSVLAVVVFALCAVPVAGQVGDLTYDASMRTVNEQTQSRHSVDAEVIQGSVGMPADFESSAYVRVQWRDGTTMRSELVVSPATVTAGETVTIWLDDAGKVASAPLTAFDAKVNAVGVTGAVWFAVVACSALVAFFSRRALDRSRARAWERELYLLAHNDDGWANRHI